MNTLTKSGIDKSFEANGANGSSEQMDFEKALEMTGHGKFHYLLLITCGFSFMGVITESLSMSFLLPAAQCDLQLTLSDKGILSAIVFLGLLSGCHFWGFLSDTRGRHKVMWWSLLLGVTATVLSSLAPNLWTFIVFRYFAGFLISGCAATTYAYLGEFHSNKSRAKAISYGVSFISLGLIALPGLAWIILPMTWQLYLPGLNIYYSSWRLFLLLCTVPNMISFVLLSFFPESPKFLLARGDQAAALAILKEMYKQNKGITREEYFVKSLKCDDIPANLRTKNLSEFLRLIWNQTAPLFKRKLLFNTFLASVVQFGIFATSSGFFLWFPEVVNKLMQFNQVHNHTAITVCQVLHNNTMQTFQEESIEESIKECSNVIDEEVFKIILILGCVFSVAYIIIGAIINIVGKANLLAIFLFITGSSGVAAHFAANDILIMVFFGSFLTSGVCAGIMNAIVVDLYPTHLRTMALSVTQIIGRVGAVAGSNLVGYLLEYSCPTTFFLFGGELIGCGVLVLIMKTKMPKSGSS